MMNAQQFWSQHLAAIQSQGVSASAYAKQHGLALSSLYYWQRKLRAAAAASGALSTAAPCIGTTSIIATAVSAM